MKKKLVLQPLRFVEAHYNFTAIQQDFIMLVQAKANEYRNNPIKNDFKINLKPYFQMKKISLKNIRPNDYKSMCEDLIKASIGFQYFKSDTSITFFSLFKSCSITTDLFLNVSINDDVLPLFFIKKLEENHFIENKFVKEIFSENNNNNNFDKYVAFLPETYVDFKNAGTKRLFQKLLQYKSLGKKTFNFNKDELYLLLGYGSYNEVLLDDKQKKIFDNIKKYEFIQNKFKGVNGWKNVSKNLKKWLAEINDNENSEISISLQNGNLFKVTGKPVRDIQIKVVYDDIKKNLTDEQEVLYVYIQKYKLSPKQRYYIVKNFEEKEIKLKINDNIVVMKNQKGNKYFGEKKRADFRKIDNIAGYVFNLFKKII
ncbi:replication initiation protein [Tenacibaculum finnmarkense]|uniref:replication initiation protein n=1 Tax=Tenacibaculum finnmarkense TaxID=2781243 RepID=UPI001EFBFF33|nr:replication initiation protein [Tenacibaculum finnmarkense]MCG8226404.1 hypothetical protein [Tenacibaculum finnmarkense genomovar finnmarkense]